MKKLLILFIFVFVSHSVWADCVNPTGVSGQQIFNSVNSEMMFCDGGSWWVMKNVPLGGHMIQQDFLVCDVSLEGVVRYNNYRGIVEVCNGVGWMLIASGDVNTDPDPDAYTFTDLTNQTIGTGVFSNIITVNGFNGKVVASVSGDTSARLQVNGGPWQTNALVQTGDLVRLMVTTSPDPNVTRNIVFSVGSISDTWSVTTRGPGHRIFYTNSTYQGSSLGGLEGADSICQTEADTQTFGGTWKAVISDEQTDARDRLTIDYPVMNACDSSLVERDDLFETQHEGLIKRTNCTINYHYVWTGSTNNGRKISGSTCDSWYSENGVGYEGRMNYTSATTWISTDSAACNTSQYLVCIEQDAVTPPATGPPAFDFVDQSGVGVNSGVLSNTVTLGAFAGSVEVTAVGPGTPLISVNGATFEAGPKSVVAGDTVRLKLVTILEINHAHVVNVNIGTTSDTWTVTTQGAGSEVFYTASTYAPSTFSGLAGADSTCQTEAGTHGYGGTWKAVMSDQTTSALNRINFNYPVVNACDSSIVEISNMWSTSHEDFIRQGGGCGYNYHYVITGTFSDGENDEVNTCTSWSVGTGNYLAGRMGYLSGGTWSNSDLRACSESQYLLCVKE